MDVVTQKAFIQDDMDSIRYYAQEIGLCKWMLERIEDDKDRQLWTFFLVLAEAEMENVNDRARKLREGVNDWELRHRGVPGV